ncbi:hypothetical protein HYZ99_05320 [Candidatus Peregrinibacteria bacterium]|nr:hypothetical protein [Candidatus Peregrinibacteria bacterium]
MLPNHVYNLMEQLVQESQSLWRLDQYIRDAKKCKDCRTFWKKLKKDKEAHIKELTAMVKKHCNDK